MIPRRSWRNSPPDIQTTTHMILRYARKNEIERAAYDYAVWLHLWMWRMRMNTYIAHHSKHAQANHIDEHANVRNACWKVCVSMCMNIVDVQQKCRPNNDRMFTSVELSIKIACMYFPPFSHSDPIRMPSSPVSLLPKFCPNQKVSSEKWSKCQCSSFPWIDTPHSNNVRKAKTKCMKQ